MIYGIDLFSKSDIFGLKFRAVIGSKLSPSMGEGVKMFLLENHVKYIVDTTDKMQMIKTVHSGK